MIEVIPGLLPEMEPGQVGHPLTELVRVLLDQRPQLADLAVAILAVLPVRGMALIADLACLIPVALKVGPDALG